MAGRRNTWTILEGLKQIPAEIPDCSVEKKVEKSTWARLIKKVYGTDPLECPRCGSEMKILAVIVDLRETEKILKAFWLRSADLLPILIQLL